MFSVDAIRVGNARVQPATKGERIFMTTHAQVGSAPVASVVLTGWSEEAGARATIDSVLAQTFASLELIIPACAPFAQSYARQDARVRIGEGASHARGVWVGFARGGETMHPERLRRLIDAAQRDGADIILDDLIRLDAAIASAPFAQFRGVYERGPVWLSAERFVKDAAMLGGLSPLVRRALLADRAVEDHQALVAGLIGAGARARTHPLPLRFCFGTGLGAAQRPAAPKRAVLLSRQRIAGATSGASYYVLSLARALKGAGFAVDYVGVSPTLFGRWPVLPLRRETSVFDSISVRRGVRLRNWIVALDPKVALNGLVAGFAVLLKACGFGVHGWPRPAEWSISAAAKRADMLYVADKVRGRADLILCDYAFLAPMAAYALAPNAPKAVIMHDLWSAPVDADGAANDQPIARLDPAAELDLLGQVDAALAIQPEEAGLIRRALPHTRTILTPCAMKPVDRAQPGENGAILFVGSNTTHNLRGLEWFLHHCWATIRAENPQARLIVAGSVRRRLGAHAPKGVKIMGVVGDLRPLYARAGVVIAPLRAGSGLKVKLVEALAAGKAMVATSAAAHGVADMLGQALALEDDPIRFTRAVLDLLDNPARREAMGEAALTAIRRDFSERVCYDEFVQFALAASEPGAGVIGASGDVDQAERLPELDAGLR